MKRLVLLAIVASFIFGMVASANAATEVKFKGRFEYMWAWIDNGDLHDMDNDNASEDDFVTDQRVRWQMDFIASENVKGVLQFEIGENEWGIGAWDLGADGIAVEVKHAYIEFNVPNTDLLFRVGVQGLALPTAAAFGGSNIFDNDVAAILGVYPINDMFTVAAFWARAATNTNFADDAANSLGEYDLFGILLPITVDGMVNITPFFMYGIAGDDAYFNLAPQGLLAMGVSDDDAQNLGLAAVQAAYDGEYVFTWWAGAAIEVTAFDPLTIALDVDYGSVDSEDEYLDRSGWLLSAQVAYALDFMTPTLSAWWSTGDDDDLDNGSERMPYLNNSGGPTSMGFDGGMLLQGDGFLGHPAGTWGIALGLEDVSFIEGLTHALRIAYVGGTNSSNVFYDGDWGNRYVGPSGSDVLALGAANDIVLTTSDYAWEVNFDHKYMIYENLSLMCEMGFLDVQRDKDAWYDNRGNNPQSAAFNANQTRDYDTDTVWKLGFGLRYDF